MSFKSLDKKVIINCALCKDAPCSEACDKLDPASVIRSIRFDNEKVAAGRLGEISPCINCAAPCEKACIRPGSVPVKNVISELCTLVCPQNAIIPGNKRIPKTRYYSEN